MSIHIHTSDEAEKVNRAFGQIDRITYAGMSEIQNGHLTVDAIAQVKTTKQMVRVIIEPGGMAPGQGTKISMYAHKPMPETERPLEEDFESSEDLIMAIRHLMSLLTSPKVNIGNGDNLNLDK